MCAWNKTFIYYVVVFKYGFYFLLLFKGCFEKVYEEPKLYSTV